MPYLFEFHLQGPPPRHPFRLSASLREQVLGWIDIASGEGVQAFQEAGRPAPYGVGPLRRVSGEGNICSFVVSVLTDDVAALLLKGVSRHGRRIRLGGREYGFDPVPLCLAMSYWEELQAATPETRWAFILRTPTAHHRTGYPQKTVPLPAPEDYFGSWITRWDQYGPRPMPESLRSLAAERIAVTSCAGRTECVGLEQGHWFLGFIGDVTFAVLEPETVPDEMLSYLTTLARFSAFCGTGAGTTLGMGVTELRLDIAKDRSISAPVQASRQPASRVSLPWWRVTGSPERQQE